MRYKYLDYAKGMGILLIMMHHVFQYFPATNSIALYVQGYHVTIFFIVSGMIAYMKKDRNEPIKKILVKKIKSFIIPYIFFSIINSVIKLGILFITHSLDNDIIREEMVALLITGNGTVWFLSALFIIEIIYEAIKKIRNVLGRNIVLITSAIVTMVLPFIISGIKTPVIIVIARAMEGYSYYIIGYFTFDLLRNMSLKNAYSYILLAFGWIVWFVFPTKMGYMGAYFDYFVPTTLFNVFSCFGILILCISLSRKIKENKILSFIRYFGENSLIIMLVHPTILLVLTYLEKQYFAIWTKSIQIPFAVVLFVTLVFLEVPFIKLINNKMSFLIGKF